MKKELDVSLAFDTPGLQEKTILQDSIWADCPDCGIYRYRSDEYDRCAACAKIFAKVKKDWSFAKKRQALTQRFQKDFLESKGEVAFTV